MFWLTQLSSLIISSVLRPSVFRYCNLLRKVDLTLRSYCLILLISFSLQ